MDKYLIGLYDDEEILMDAVKKVRANGLKIHDVMTPFPVHGLEDVMGLKESRLHTVGFIAGATGLTLALAFITWITTVSYPTIFGGKPYFSFPSFVPISFEITVLSAAVSMVIAFFARCGLKPTGYPKIYDERTTDHLFAMVFDMNDEEKESQKETMTQLLNETGAIEIKEKDFDESEY